MIVSRGERVMIEKTSTYKFVIRDAEGVEIGEICLGRIGWMPKKPFSFGIGIWLDYRDQGFGTDAVRAFARYFFGHYRGQHALYLQVHPDNGRARRCYEKCGFKECPGSLQVSGEHRNMVLRREDVGSNDLIPPEKGI